MTEIKPKYAFASIYSHLTSSELEQKSRNFKLVFLDTGKIFWKNFQVVRIATERALL